MGQAVDPVFKFGSVQPKLGSNARQHVVQHSNIPKDVTHLYIKRTWCDV